MSLSKSIGKREFIQNTSKYIKWVEEHSVSLIITHHNHPAIVLSKVKLASLKDLRGTVQIKVHGDINEHVLPGYNEW